MSILWENRVVLLRDAGNHLTYSFEGNRAEEDLSRGVLANSHVFVLLFVVLVKWRQAIKLKPSRAQVTAGSPL